MQAVILIAVAAVVVLVVLAIVALVVALSRGRDGVERRAADAEGRQRAQARREDRPGTS